MTCRHGKDDPSCSSHRDYRPPSPPEPKTPDSANYTVEDVREIGPHLVLKVAYPNCKKCSYEGVKVLVYLNVSTLAALKWRKIDPHFTDPESKSPVTEAPGPAARFPASAEGWQDAIEYATRKADRSRIGKR